MAKVFARNLTANAIFIPLKLSSGKKTAIGIGAGIGTEVELTALGLTQSEIERSPELLYAQASPQSYISIYSSVSSDTQQGQTPLRVDLVAGTPTTPPTIAAYYINVNAGELMLNGKRMTIVASADLDLMTAIAKTIAGGAVAALADTFKKEIALVAVNVAGVLTLKAVHGVAVTTTPVRPTRAEVNASMAAAFTYTADQLVIIGYIKHERAGAAITQTFVDVLV